jgi:hypothetical protein
MNTEKQYRTKETIAVRGRLVAVDQLVKLDPDKADAINKLYKRTVLVEVKAEPAAK